MTVTVVISEGTIYPVLSNSCRLDFWKTNNRPATQTERETSYTEAETTYNLKTTNHIVDNFDKFFNPENDVTYWKKRIVFYMINAPSIIALNFWPKNPSNYQLLGVKKCLSGIMETAGQLKAARFYPCNAATLNDSIAILETTPVYTILQSILQFFLQDRLTEHLVITFLVENQPIALGWTKV
jgi:hypothetical protein